MEEKVAHNGPLLRRVTDPFSKRTVVDNFQEAPTASRRSGTGFHPQFWRKRRLSRYRRSWREHNLAFFIEVGIICQHEHFKFLLRGRIASEKRVPGNQNFFG